jgi:hypothetical protein
MNGERGDSAEGMKQDEGDKTGLLQRAKSVKWAETNEEQDVTGMIATKPAVAPKAARFSTDAFFGRGEYCAGGYNEPKQTTNKQQTNMLNKTIGFTCHRFDSSGEGSAMSKSASKRRRFWRKVAMYGNPRC